MLCTTERVVLYVFGWSHKEVCPTRCLGMFLCWVRYVFWVVSQKKVCVWVVSRVVVLCIIVWLSKYIVPNPV